MNETARLKFARFANLDSPAEPRDQASSRVRVDWGFHTFGGNALAISTDGADRMEQVAGLFLKEAPAHLHFSPRSEGRLPIGHRSGQKDPPVIPGPANRWP